MKTLIFFIDIIMILQDTYVADTGVLHGYLVCAELNITD